MSLNEFNIIKTFFQNQNLSRSDVILGSGDDAAIVAVPDNQELAITTDTLISDVHFLKNTSAYDIAYKALAVNLSDLAAMGATPAWFTTALTIPDSNEKWLKDFAAGLFDLANRYKTQLIGGDLTRGHLSITIQAVGFVLKGKALRRDQAKPGDLVYVSNTIGDAGFALKVLKNEIFSKNVPLEKLNRPEPQVYLGEKLLDIANAVIDISDGLSADLNHILEKSNVGASVCVDDIPLSNALIENLSKKDAIQIALTAGDDYQLCFTVPENKKELLDNISKDFSFTCIGKITKELGLHLHFKNGEKYVLEIEGYQHF
jgi:thiamine-monophosphate kinase